MERSQITSMADASNIQWLPEEATIFGSQEQRSTSRGSQAIDRAQGPSPPLDTDDYNYENPHNNTYDGRERQI